MACVFCAHFREDEPHSKLRCNESIVAQLAEREGQCTLNPEWEPVTGFHYCYHLRMKEPGTVAFWRTQLEEQGAAIKALEKKLSVERGKKQRHWDTIKTLRDENVRLRVELLQLKGDKKEQSHG